MPKLPESLQIFIPTRGRTDRCRTIENFCLEELPWRVTLVVPSCELDAWKHLHPTMEISDHFKIADIRQAILSDHSGFHVVIDDDLYPALRRIDDPEKFIKVSELPNRLQVLHALFKDIEGLLNSGWIHGGVAERQGGNRNCEPYKTVGKVLRFHFYNADVVRQTGFDYTPFTVRQDYHFTLSMLELGLPNVIINWLVQDQPASNSEGGCSRYRTAKVLEDGAYQLAEAHPGLVKIVQKTPKKQWAGVEGPRTDVNVYWKKAYKKGLSYASNLQGQDRSTVDVENRDELRMQPELPVLPDSPPSVHQPE